MAYPTIVSGITIFTKAVACENKCRYCLIGAKRKQDVDQSRFLDFVERFMEWNATRDTPLKLSFSIDYSSDYDAQILNREWDLRKKLGWKDGARGIRLGGLPILTGDERLAWLRERRRVAGIRSVHASFTGHGGLHDRWNGRAGDFDNLCGLLSDAKTLGLELHQRLFLIKSTLKSTEELIGILDRIDDKSQKYLCLYYYKGLGSSLEKERLTEDQLANLPPRLSSLGRRYAYGWRSERGWADLACSAPPVPRHVNLRLEITEKTVGLLDTRSFDPLIETLTAASVKAYDAIPHPETLARRYGNRDNPNVYMSIEDMEMKWLDLHIADGGRIPDRDATHLSPDF